MSVDGAVNVQYATVPTDNKACTLQAIDSDQDLQVEPYGPSGTSPLDGNFFRQAKHRTNIPKGFAGLVASRYVAICASFSAIGGLLFGYE